MMLPNTQEINDLIELVYNALDGREDVIEYSRRHNTASMGILTQYSQDIAHETIRLLADDIKDKVVIEIGAGVGYLAIEMALIAKQVFAIEADPAWSWIFATKLYQRKPPNLTWIFGAAQAVASFLKGDIAVVVTRSDVDGMRALALQMAPRVIMPFQDFPEVPLQ